MKHVFNLKSYLTFLNRNKVYTAINVFGLSVSLMFVILLVVFVQQEYSVDTQHSKLDRIYLFAVENDKSDNMMERMSGTNAGFGPLLKRHIPGIESACALLKNEGKVCPAGGEPVPAKILCVDTTFYSIFDFELTAGDRSRVLSDPDQVAISEAFARRLFADRNPMGQHLRIDDNGSLTVAGVFKDMGNSIVETPDLVRSMERYVQQDSSLVNYNNNLLGIELFLLAKEGVDLRAKTATMHKLLKEKAPAFFDSDSWHMRPLIVPLRGLYLNLSASSGVTRRGDAGMVRIFGIVAIIILLFSVMNYINLTVAQSGYRAREMASRRLFGAQRGEIVLKLIMESVALCLLSLAVGLALALWLAPYVGQLLETRLLMERLLMPANIVAILGMALLIGILAGIAPAVIQSRAKPIEVVRGTFRKTTRMLFSRVFIVVQNVVTIVLIATALTIYFQIRHMVNAPLGYNHQGVMSVFAPFSNSYDKTNFRAFQSELQKLPGVELVSCCTGSPLNITCNGYYLDGKPHWIYSYSVDENWLKLLGIPVEVDYGVKQEGTAYVTRQLLADLGLSADTRSWLPYGEKSTDQERQPIRGIIGDFHLGEINNDMFHELGIAVRVYHDVLKDEQIWPTWLIKLRGDEAEGYAQVQALYKKFFKEELNEDDEWELPFLDQQIAMYYKEQQRLFNVVSLFAAIAVLISLLGLIAMSTYFIQQRRKEIAVRKVFGSTSNQIRRKLIRSFLVYVVAAFVLAVPIVWHYMGDWLSEFNYRIQLWPWILVAGFTCFIISLLAVFIQSYLASNENPINHIKDL